MSKEPQKELLDFMVGNKTRRLENIAKLMDKIDAKQQIIYEKNPNNEFVNDILCDITDLINLCRQAIENSF